MTLFLYKNRIIFHSLGYFWWYYWWFQSFSFSLCLFYYFDKKLFIFNDMWM